MTKKRRGEEPSPEIRRQAESAAGLLADIFDVDKDELLNRPRPSGILRCVRDVLIGVLHHKTGISQQKIAAALGRDRGVVSDAAWAISEASRGDIAVNFALDEISAQIANVLAQKEAWREALRQQALDDAIAAAATDRQTEADEDEALDEELEQAAAATPATKVRCHTCYGKGHVRIHQRTSDPAYRDAWTKAELVSRSPDGFHTLTCRFCNGAGERSLAKPPQISDAPTLAAEE